MTNRHESETVVNHKTRIAELTLKNPWVWVLVQGSDADEQFVGLQDQDIWFIPTFLTKDEASACMTDMPREKGKTYEVQAIRYQYLKRQAADSGFMLFILNGAGKICGKIEPDRNKNGE